MIEDKSCPNAHMHATVEEIRSSPDDYRFEICDCGWDAWHVDALFPRFNALIPRGGRTNFEYRCALIKEFEKGDAKQKAIAKELVKRHHKALAIFQRIGLEVSVK